MIDLNSAPALDSLKPKLDTFFGLAKQKVESIDREYDDANGSPVFTVGGKYTTRGWTEWTEGFRYGISILHFDATGDEASLKSGRDRTVASMASHVSHIGVHDHGGIVWDEIAGMYITLLVAPPTITAWILGFMLFRAFDIAKPWPIRDLDHRLGGGVGIMLDDLAAALYALILLALYGWLMT